MHRSPLVVVYQNELGPDGCGLASRGDVLGRVGFADDGLSELGGSPDDSESGVDSEPPPDEAGEREDALTEPPTAAWLELICCEYHPAVTLSA
jgi:hypothetical protein